MLAILPDRPSPAQRLSTDQFERREIHRRQSLRGAVLTVSNCPPATRGRAIATLREAMDARLLAANARLCSRLRRRLGMIRGTN